MAHLAAIWGPAAPIGRAPRLMGIFAHPDDEVFCIGGTIARCADAGAQTAVVSMTRGEAGVIRDAATATRRTLGSVRMNELTTAAVALRVDQARCLDLGDGCLDALPLADVVTAARVEIDEFRPDVVVTFGPDGAFGHPDHVTSCLATLEAVRTMARPPRLLHARFPTQERLLVSLLVEWLTSSEQRFQGTAAFAHALKLFADGSSMLGFAADYIDVEWFPAGSYVIEQGEPATELFCILSGSVDVIREDDAGALNTVDNVGAGCFVGEDGLATGRPRNAHVVARDDVTCLVLAPERPSRYAGRGAAARASSAPTLPAERPASGDGEGGVAVDVRSVLDRKIAALAAHRSQYALDTNLLPRSLLECLLGTEHFAVALEGSEPPDRAAG